MPLIADRVKETTTSTGTTTVNLGGAVTGWRAFSVAFVTGDVVYYCMENGTDWEVGEGTLTSGSPWTLSRTTVLASSNSGALVDFAAGTKTIFNTVPAGAVNAKTPFMGALVAPASDLTAQVVTTWPYTPSYTAEIYDTHGFHDNSTNPQRLTIPAGLGIKKVRLSACFHVNLYATAGVIHLHFNKNGASLVGSGTMDVGTSTVNTQTGVTNVSAVFDVVDGDYFECKAMATNDASVTVDAGGNYFAVEVVDATPLAPVMVSAKPFCGALVNLAADWTAQDLSSATSISWTAEKYDTHAFHDLSTNPSRLTVPSGLGITKVRLVGGINVTSHSTAVGFGVYLYKNGVQIAETPGDISQAVTTINAWANVSSPPIDVVGGDYFELKARVTGDTSVDIVASAGTFFSMEVVSVGAITTELYQVPNFMGALVKMATDVTALNASTGYYPALTVVDYDTNQFYNGSANTRLTIPAGFGIRKVKLSARVRMELVTNTAIGALIRKNGSDTSWESAGYAGSNPYVSGTDANGYFTIHTAPISVVPGDYFELRVACADTSVTLKALWTWMAIEVVSVASVAQERLPFKGALVKKAADLTAQNLSTFPYLPTWDTESYDTDGFHESVTYPARLTIPAGLGITKVRLVAAIRITNMATAGAFYIGFRKNGGGVGMSGVYPAQMLATSTTWTAANTSITSPVIEVVDGDYFEVALEYDADTSVDIAAADSFFSIEVVEGYREVIIPTRELLEADRTYYVATTGSDGNNGLSANYPFLTLQKALDVITGLLDTGSYQVTIQLADGTYTSALAITAGPMVGKNAIVINGNSTTPANVIVEFSASGDGLVASGAGANIKPQYFRLQRNGSTNVHLLVAKEAGAVTVGTNMDFGAAGTSYQISALFRGVVTLGNSYSLSGDAGRHYQISTGGVMNNASAITVTLTGGTRAITQFAGFYLNGTAMLASITFSGSATGTRYGGGYNAVCYTNAGGANYFPGNVAGSVNNGAVYA